MASFLLFLQVFGVGDEAVGANAGFVEVLFRPTREPGRVWNRFDFYVFLARNTVFAEFDFCAEGFQRSLHSGREQGDRFGEDVHDAEAHGLVKQILPLEETALLVDELVDEGDLGGGDRVQLSEIVSQDG